MRTLIFDIETVGDAWDDLDEITRTTLARWIERSAASEEERTAGRKDLKEGLGFSPLTGSIVAIGIYDLEHERGVVYYRTENRMKNADDRECTADGIAGGYALKPRSEKEMIEAFWEGAASYDTFVTFNGRGFDVPFLNLRSAIHGIRPSKDLMEGRYLSQQKHAKHIDLQDQMTFYGAMHRRPSLHLFCRAFGIESPKAAGVAGDDVAALYAAKKFSDIARYNARDVTATAELYKKWLAYLAPTNFS